jgi:1,2-phenylacetyl-CoA epoxidase PaaB subunit
MKILKIRKQWTEPNDNGDNRYEVTYKMRMRGNTHHYTTVMAQDEMEAFMMVRQSILANEEQAGIKNVNNFELLQKQFPKAGYEKELRKARKLLRDIRNEIFGDQP